MTKKRPKGLFTNSSKIVSLEIEGKNYGRALSHRSAEITHCVKPPA
jgi:hypothetical protein